MKSKYQKTKCNFWILEKKKCLSFHSETGYEIVCAATLAEMWQRIYRCIEEGYRVR